MLLSVIGEIFIMYLYYRVHLCVHYLEFGGCSLFGCCYHIVYKWKNHFSEMKGDVGMSCHLMKKKGNKKMPTQRQKVIQPHPYIFVFQCA